MEHYARRHLIKLLIVKAIIHESLKFPGKRTIRKNILKHLLGIALEILFFKLYLPFFIS